VRDIAFFSAHNFTPILPQLESSPSTKRHLLGSTRAKNWR